MTVPSPAESPSARLANVAGQRFVVIVIPPLSPVVTLKDLAVPYGSLELSTDRGNHWARITSAYECVPELGFRYAGTLTETEGLVILLQVRGDEELESGIRVRWENAGILPMRLEVT